LADLDSGAKEQQIIVRRATSVLRSIPRAAKREGKFISETLAQAQRLQILNWELSWTLPVIATTCQVTTAVCVTSSNLPILGEYRANNVRLRDLTTAVVNRIKAYQGGKPTRRETRLLAAAERQFTANLKLSETVPEAQVACVLPSR
jgi:hypothetical protein